MGQTTNRKLLDFIEKAPTAFQAVEQMEERLSTAGFQEVFENRPWKIVPGGKYYVTRNHSALIAFSVPENILEKSDLCRFHIMASHSDSPCFKIKENPEIKGPGSYVKLNVEKYGGMIMSSWVDRPLSAAGRIVIRKDGQIVEKNIQIKKDLMVIPGLAIHMNREVNDGCRYNAQKDMLPLFAGDGKTGFGELLARETGICEKEILGMDMYLYNRMPGCVWGAAEEFISAPRLDDLQCAFASLEGFLSADRKGSIAVHCVLDNEEVGSGTRQGAASVFLRDTLRRILLNLGMDEERYMMAMADSFMVSADNAHAVHPNYSEKCDPVNQPELNKGIVIKYHAGQKYCTDGVSAAVFREMCEKAGVPYQTFVNRSDMAGGSTLGNISSTQAPVKAVDIGLPQLSMHSAFETAGAADTEYLIRAARVLFA